MRFTIDERPLVTQWLVHVLEGVYSITERPLAVHWYVFMGESKYKERGPVACVLTVTYSHQGKTIYITGTHDGEMPSGFRSAVIDKARSKGIKLIEWEHSGKIRSQIVGPE